MVARLVPVAWPPASVAYLIAALLGGALVKAGLQTILLNRSGQLAIPAAVAAAAPAVGAILWFWHRQINHYTSSGL